MSWEDRDYASGDPTYRADGFGGLGRGAAGRFADNPLNWAPTIGHLFGIRIRVHITLIAFILFDLIQSLTLGTLIFELVLFGSILLHEFGHCFAARRMGGSADDILMWPLGGLASVDAPRRPKEQFVTVICGPLVNVALIIVSVATVVVLGGKILFTTTFPYLYSIGPTQSYLDDFLFAMILTNVALFVFNLLPMYPMDGGRMLHCGLWKGLGYYKATMTTCTIGMVTAFVVGLYAIAARQYMLIVIAIFGYMACYQERQMTKASGAVETNEFGYDFSGGYSTLNRSSGKPNQPGFFAKWKQKKQQGKWHAQREREAADQMKVDEILDKVKQHGIGSLSAKEKKMLEDATRRQNAADRRHGL